MIEYPQFYGLEVSLSSILMICLFRSNNRMVTFSKTAKKIILQQTRKGQSIYDVHMEILLFLNKRSIVHFADEVDDGGKKIGHYLWPS